MHQQPIGAAYPCKHCTVNLTRDQTIESLPDVEREAALYHVEWATDELGDEQSARDFVTLALKILGPQAKDSK